MRKRGSVTRFAALDAMNVSTSWKVRRRCLFVTNGLCWVVVFCCVFGELDTSVAYLAIKCSFAIVGLTTIVYILGVVGEESIVRFLNARYPQEKQD